MTSLDARFGLLRQVAVCNLGFPSAVIIIPADPIEEHASPAANHDRLRLCKSLLPTCLPTYIVDSLLAIGPNGGYA